MSCATLRGAQPYCAVQNSTLQYVCIPKSNVCSSPALCPPSPPPLPPVPTPRPYPIAPRPRPTRGGPPGRHAATETRPCPTAAGCPPPPPPHAAGVRAPRQLHRVYWCGRQCRRAHAAPPVWPPDRPAGGHHSATAAPSAMPPLPAASALPLAPPWRRCAAAPPYQPPNWRRRRGTAGVGRHALPPVPPSLISSRRPGGGGEGHPASHGRSTGEGCRGPAQHCLSPVKIFFLSRTDWWGVWPAEAPPAAARRHAPAAAYGGAARAPSAALPPPPPPPPPPPSQTGGGDVCRRARRRRHHHPPRTGWPAQRPPPSTCTRTVTKENREENTLWRRAEVCCPCEAVPPGVRGRRQGRGVPPACVTAASASAGGGKRICAAS
ncbi:hypothetical protein I4F81_004878 [Pyropia yezoensis]|uniref:Uncharacterized protein n=1 Tax=Pyropia yezoensis TaxID=2788 RepID=A0ACC3BWJ8_PYRYE|nr:hypothetical protein I4F81_004878 [Neopyropia yezoensis]